MLNFVAVKNRMCKYKLMKFVQCYQSINVCKCVSVSHRVGKHEIVGCDDVDRIKLPKIDNVITQPKSNGGAHLFESFVNSAHTHDLFSYAK